ncbi:MAG: gliding motility-associated C-terminal domain-containing protein [Bacteroidetes bacterium]|nr:gliding motility-associated C-terminal domain-containing protein [Bacteroidota bacterium]
MKRLFVLLLLFVSLASVAQLHVSVTPTGTFTWCYKDSVGYTAKISGTDTSGVSYRWQKNGVDVFGADSAYLIFPHAKPSDTGEYRCIASKWAMIDTSNIVTLKMHPAMKFDTLYRYNALACPLQCKGQFKALVSGGTPFTIYPPYRYNWHGGHNQDTLCFGICPGKHRLTVTDSMSCSIDSIYFVDVLKLPKVRYTITPVTFDTNTIYLSNPTATLQFNDTSRQYMTNWKWYMYYNVDSTVTTSNVNPVSYTYDRSGPMLTMLRFRDNNSCDTTLQDTLTVKIINLFIPNAMTSSPGYYNDKLIMKEIISKDNYKDITLSDVYLSNELWIYDRWGRKVYHTTNYVNNTWEIGKLSDGTYFYVFKGHGLYGDDMHHGSIQIFK